MRAIMVAVNYTDLLAVTLPYNRHHFDEVHIVTDEKCLHEVLPIADANDASVWHTELFYERGASFNKWAALEWGLDQIGREGWLCLMDADVLWPKAARFQEVVLGQRVDTMNDRNRHFLRIGQLTTPLRRMAPWPVDVVAEQRGSGFTKAFERTKEGYVIPSEQSWSRYPIHRNVREWAGYSQIFHASDPVLGPPPWHEVDWKHAGGADSIFQRKWPAERKVRPPWEVLHLGEAGKNWFGRGADPRLTDEVWKRRRQIRQAGGSEAEQFKQERFDSSDQLSRDE